MVGEAKQPDRLERSSFDAQCVQRRIEVGWSAKRQAWIIEKEPHALGRGTLRGDDASRIGERTQPRQPCGSGGGDRQAGDHRHDAVELEGSERARIHFWNAPVY